MPDIIRRSLETQKVRRDDHARLRDGRDVARACESTVNLERECSAHDRTGKVKRIRTENIESARWSTFKPARILICLSC